MTSVELMIEFNRLAGNVYQLFDTEDRLNPYDIQGYLNKAQDEIMRLKYLSYATPYENIIALNNSYDEISSLIEVTGATAGGTGPDYPYLLEDAEGYGSNVKKIISYPDNFIYYVASESNVTREKIETVTNQWTENNLISYEQITGVITGVGNFPINLSPKVYVSDEIYFISDPYTILNKVKIRYLKEPEKLDIIANNECQLPKHLHYNVADTAVRLYLQSFKNQEEDK